MKRTFLALALAFGTTAAFATPTLEFSGDELRSGSTFKRAEGTSYQADTQGRGAREPRNDYPFTWNP